MARKIDFFACRSVYGFRQCRSAPMAWLALVILFRMSMSSVRSKDMKEPRYLKWAVKLMNAPLSSSAIRSVVGDCQYKVSRCCMNIVGFCVCVSCIEILAGKGVRAQI